LTEISLKKQLEINDFTHANGIKFIATDVRGLFGLVDHSACLCIYIEDWLPPNYVYHFRIAFNDFGSEFVVTDTTGENPLTGMVAAISNEIEGVITCLDETRHGLEDGTYVTFSEIKGMVELNGCEPKKVKVLGKITNIKMQI